MENSPRGVTGRPGDSHLHEISSDPEVIPDQAPLQTLYYSIGNKPSPQTSYVRKRFPNWIVFVLSAFAIAIIAAVIGGLVGKTIEHHNCSTTIDEAKASAVRNPPITTAASVSVTTPATIPAPAVSASVTTSNTIPVPTTGCPGLNGHTLQSTFANITYKLTCNVDWVGYDVGAVSADTISACVEACSTVSQYNHTTCVGVTWVPAWINTTLAMEQVQVPGNCFMKYYVDGLPPNKMEFESVVAFLEQPGD